MSSKKLTGNKRIVQDCVVALYNCVQKWKFHTCDCYSVVKRICMLKNYSRHDEDGNLPEEARSDLKSFISQLLLKLQELELVAAKIGQISRKLNSVQKLSALQGSTDENFDQEVSKLSLICKSAEQIERMYTEEFKTKSSITRDICIHREESHLTFLEAHWKYEANIDTDLVDSCLKRIIFILQLHSQLS